MNLLRPIAGALMLLSLPGMLCAQQDGASSAPEAVGSETCGWVDLQTGGSAASPVARPMPGDIAGRVYQRHADSFAQPIPDSLGRESFVEKGGGGK